MNVSSLPAVVIFAAWDWRTRSLPWPAFGVALALSLEALLLLGESWEWAGFGAAVVAGLLLRLPWADVRALALLGGTAGFLPFTLAWAGMLGIVVWCLRGRAVALVGLPFLPWYALCLIEAQGVLWLARWYGV